MSEYTLAALTSKYEGLDPTTIEVKGVVLRWSGVQLELGNGNGFFRPLELTDLAEKVERTYFRDLYFAACGRTECRQQAEDNLRQIILLWPPKS